MYMNTETGEILTRAQALEQWRTEYDGDDPTNAVEFGEIFKRIQE